MRKILITLLLAGAATSPAFAAQDADSPHHWRGDRPAQNVQPPQAHQDDHQQAREEHQQVREQARVERSNGGSFNRGDQPRMDRPQPQPGPAVQQADSGRRGGWDRSRVGHSDNPASAVDQRQAYDRAYRQGSPNWTNNRQSGDRSNWQQRRGTWNGSADQYRQREAWQYQQQQRVRDGSRWASGGWNRDWRNDRRYDWRNYRDRHRSVFRLGIYYDPFGYGYRSFDIGYRLQPNYFGQQYWIDPARYGLPFPPPGTSWVRYWNDALLVDTYSGEVVDVIHNFFW
jgi:Ni/Co efflux regulator RcnB